LNLSDASGMDLGLSYAYTPEVRVEDAAQRHLSGVDLTYRWQPLSQTQYRGLVWGTEALWNQEDRPAAGPAAAASTALAASPVVPLDPVQGQDLTFAALRPAAATDPTSFKRRDAYGLYSYLEGRFSRNVYAGLLYEYAEDIDRGGETTQALSPYLTIWPSEFQRIRLEYSRVEHPDHLRGDDDRFFLQWTVILGSHVHSFRDR